jgi:hypothetical protein
MYPLGARGSVSGPLGASPVSLGANWYLGPWPATAPYPAEAAIPAASCVAAYQPHWGTGTIYARTDAASYANSKINLANPGTYNATEGTAPAWAAGTGWSKVAVGQYLLTGITPVNPMSGIAEFGNVGATATARSPFGSRGGAGERFHVSPNNAGGGHSYGYGAGTNVAAIVASGNMAVNPLVGYLNAVVDAAIAAGAPSGFAIYLLDTNVAGAPGGTGTLDSYATAFYNIALTANQVANIAWAMGKISGRVP